MSTIIITAIICTRNRAAFLGAAIESLLAQDYPSGSYQVMIVDNDSTDDTRQVCDAYSRNDVRYVCEKRVGLAHARNTGWKEARTPLVAFLDDDAEAECRWLSSAVRCFESLSPVPAWVGGPVVLNWHGKRPVWMNLEMEEALGALDWGEAERWLEPHERLVGCNSCFHCDALQHVGGFDAGLGRMNDLLLSGEETQLQRRLESRGYRLYYHPYVSMKHHVAPERLEPEYFYRRFFWGGITDVFIRDTLRSLGIEDMSLPSAAATGSVDVWSRVKRLSRHMLGATGVMGQTRAIWSRVYLSYVAGSLLAPRYRRLCQIKN